ncbi:hypothetical protein T230_13210 [Tannerella sp. oral taxon BU063 isolate Cell 1/3]|uniref:Uncharacterized protein n=1 Tax=Tannerella sp. oral taxon BU063 isolate Cell 1/3 TaxID=1411022 RepID=W2CGP3_9BACT|nr:hypothetical protein T230_13210 [Tannerella sp. oral taxon BU063 isolate Cell 1/3]
MKLGEYFLHVKLQWEAWEILIMLLKNQGRLDAQDGWDVVRIIAVL